MSKQDSYNPERARAVEGSGFDDKLAFFKGTGILQLVEERVKSIPGASIEVTDSIPDDLPSGAIVSPGVSIIGPKSGFVDAVDYRDRACKIQTSTRLTIEVNRWGSLNLLNMYSYRQKRQVFEGEEREVSITSRVFDGLMSPDPNRQAQYLESALVVSGIIEPQE